MQLMEGTVNLDTIAQLVQLCQFNAMLECIVQAISCQLQDHSARQAFIVPDKLKFPLQLMGQQATSAPLVIIALQEV